MDGTFVQGSLAAPWYWDQGRGGPTGRALAYRCYAQKCIELASTLQVPRERHALHHMAQVWVRLAQEEEEASGRSQKEAVGDLD